MRRQVSFYPPAPLHDRLLELAGAERRPVAATVLLLVEEALAARRGPRTLGEGVAENRPENGVVEPQGPATPPPSPSAHKRTVTPDPRKP